MKLWCDLCADDGVRLPVQETEPVQLQSSVRPFFSRGRRGDEAGEVSQLVPVPQPPVRDEEEGDRPGSFLWLSI